MRIISACTVALTALLGVAAADLLCILQELIVVTPDHFFGNPSRSCLDIESKFSRTRKELKKCASFEIDTSQLEALHYEFCDLNSPYRQKFDRQKHCLSLNMRNSMRCLSSMENSPNLSIETILGKSLNDICSSVSREVSKCLNDNVGVPCGREGQEVYGRITKASEPFFMGTCLSAAGSALGDAETAHEIAKAEQSAVEATVTEKDSMVQRAAAPPNSTAAPLWCLLLGLLFTVKWL